MNFDVVIIGGGLAGLTCGIALQEQGKRCAIVNNGQPAMDFSTGSMDLLSRLPNGENISQFDRAFDSLQFQLPNHPYCLIGKEKTQQRAQQFEDLAERLHLNLQGSFKQNHQRVTPLGGLFRTWLSPISVPALSLSDSAFPYEKIAVLGIEGYHDFQPQLLADNLVLQPQFAHCEIKTGFLHLPELDLLRQQSREFRSVHIAQVLENQGNLDDLVEQIEQAANGAQAVFLPACLGLDKVELCRQLQEKTALKLFELPTLPPSLLGGRQRKKLRQHFESIGGIMMNGDRALSAEYNEDGTVQQIFTQIHENEPLRAKHFVLASGSFFSNGLVSEFGEIYEPVFRADMVRTEQFDAKNHFSWTVNRFSAPQPYQSAGVVINQYCQVQKCGQFLPNLYAVGAVIGGFNALSLGCSSGVSVVSALTVVDHILGQA